jgi:hypothetical protein
LLSSVRAAEILSEVDCCVFGIDLLTEFVIDELSVGFNLVGETNCCRSDIVRSNGRCRFVDIADKGELPLGKCLLSLSPESDL